MGKHSCIIMLIYFSVGEIDHEAVSVVILDAAGIGYAYNTPKGDCSEIAFQCVSKLLEITTGISATMLIDVVPFKMHSRFDGGLYAYFVTSSCLSKLNDMKSRTYSLVDIRPSPKDARPTRIITNMKFLMDLLRSPRIQEELLLDELNVLDSFRTFMIAPMIPAIPPTRRR
jgi:hypothetical protein